MCIGLRSWLPSEHADGDRWAEVFPESEEDEQGSEVPEEDVEEGAVELSDGSTVLFSGSGLGLVLLLLFTCLRCPDGLRDGCCGSCACAIWVSYGPL